MDSEAQENKILNEIFSYCENCQNRLSCPEKECVLYRIEKIILGEDDDL